MRETPVHGDLGWEGGEIGPRWRDQNPIEAVLQTIASAHAQGQIIKKKLHSTYWG